MLLTFRYRVKDATAGKRLERMVVEVNQVWNYCGQIQNDSRRFNRKWPSGYDLITLTNGCSKELGLHSDTVQDVCKQFAIRRGASHVGVSAEGQSARSVGCLSGAHAHSRSTGTP